MKFCERKYIEKQDIDFVLKYIFLISS